MAQLPDVESGAEQFFFGPTLINNQNILTNLHDSSISKKKIKYIIHTVNTVLFQLILFTRDVLFVVFI